MQDYFELQKLSPSYRVFFEGRNQSVDIYSDLARDSQAFESLQTGAGDRLRQYLQKSEDTYNLATDQLLYKNYNSTKDFLSPPLLRQATKLNMLSNLHSYTLKYFKDPRLQQIMEYPSVFLGASPYSAPAFYNLLNHALFNQGVFYPKGGMVQVTRALTKIGAKHNVQIHLNSVVQKIIVENRRAVGVIANGQEQRADVVISNADTYHTETSLLELPHRDHSQKYWRSRTVAPSALLIYLGVSRKYGTLQHHNLVFAENWRRNFAELDSTQFPNDPSFYVCSPSRTDPSVAPKGKENLFVLVPIPAGLSYTNQQLESFADKILRNMETELSLQNLRKSLEYKKLFCVRDFENRFNSFRGSGLGLAHSLKQTAIFRPSNRSKKVGNLYFVGANTHPGIGLPSTLISAQLVADRLL